MSLYFGNKKIGNIGITNGIGLDTSDADMTPADGQNGKIYYANGKRYVGTGKCFEFANYGTATFDLIFDEHGNDRYGITLQTPSVTNIIFISSIPNSDIVVQEIFNITEIEENKALKVGTNLTTNGDIFAFHSQGHIFIYCEDVQNIKSEFNYFIGKDRYV